MFINVFGLAVGMAVSILIFLFVQHELSYDTFHANSDRVVRVSRAWFNPDGEISLHLGHTAPPFGPLIKAEYPDEVAFAARMLESNPLVTSGDTKFIEDHFTFADPEVFDIFSIKILEGDSKKALEQNDGVMISQSSAIKYFGDSSPMGKELLINLSGQEFTFQVRGVFEDFPDNSHFHPTFFASMLPVVMFYGGPDAFMGNFGSNSFSTYLRLNEGVDRLAFEGKLPNLIDKYMGETQAGTPMSTGTKLYLWPLEDIHLYSNLDTEIEANGDIAYVYIYLAVALFILLIACINFMNLSTARSSLRSLEVGLRKVMGADKGNLIRQFMGESFMLTTISMVIALVLVNFFLPMFSDFTEKQLSLNFIQNPEFLIGILGLILVVGLISGSYPALFLSGFQPGKVLKGVFKAGKSHEQFRSVLVVGQFAISVVLIVAVLVVVNQLDFMQSKDLGFEKEDIVLLPTSPAIQHNYNIIKDRLESHTGIQAVTVSSRAPSGRLLDNQGSSVEIDGKLTQLEIRIADIDVSHNFLKTYGIPLAAGRDFDVLRASDSTEAFILNETAIREIGWESPEAAIGKQFLYGSKRGFVTGVMKDFHFENLHQPIVPLLFEIGTNGNNVMSIKIDADQREETLAYLKEEWAALRPGFPFEPRFVDQGFNEQYAAEQRVKTIFTFFSGLAVIISILGLFGLTTFATQQRTREIGIRKVMGAETANILVLLGKDFLKLVMIGFLIAIPISWFGMSSWLEDFAYNVGISWTVFLWAGLIAGAVAAITVMSQSLKAAWANPVKSIKSE
ncbi:ABC transporter permease [Algoriphagus antarcticus]|uniref:Putative ABC transport system permease protein n=1 Tax=Algoriphagus antarcticus TaxID=238540 RepID=A0A3E0DZK5_9BACT|nr:ABC transporter permease [Algoriphagus antarcticus]REG91391.1 putative ABC transport system permease protein [Algoriphagus antarcticus]